MGFGVTPSVYIEKHKRHTSGTSGLYTEEVEDTVALYSVLIRENPRRNVILAIISK